MSFYRYQTFELSNLPIFMGDKWIGYTFNSNMMDELKQYIEYI